MARPLQRLVWQPLVVSAGAFSGARWAHDHYDSQGRRSTSPLVYFCRVPRLACEELVRPGTKPLQRAWLLDFVRKLKDENAAAVSADAAAAILREAHECIKSHCTSAVMDMQLSQSGERKCRERFHRCVVVGDLHGQLPDLMWILFINGMPSETQSYIFNGDLVDRGSHSLEVALVVLVLKLLHPQMVYINRGNHECADTNARYGFYDELREKFGNVRGRQLFAAFNKVFDCLPFATIVGNDTFVVHGGLFRNQNVTVQMLQSLPTASWQVQPGDWSDINDAPVEKVAMMDAVWSDPVETNGIHPSPRGDDLVTFGPDVTARFLAKNDLKLVIRSHSFPLNLCGNEFAAGHDEQLLTIFSASNYCEVGNKGSSMVLRADHCMEFAEHYEPKLKDILLAEEANEKAVAQVRKSLKRLLQNEGKPVNEPLTEAWGRKWRSFMEGLVELSLWEVGHRIDEVSNICGQNAVHGHIRLSDWHKACNLAHAREFNLFDKLPDELLHGFDAIAGLQVVSDANSRSKIWVSLDDAVTSVVRKTEIWCLEDFVQESIVMTFDILLRSELTIESMLRLFDHNADQHVTFEEFQEVLRRLGLPLDLDLLISIWFSIHPPAYASTRSLLSDPLQEDNAVLCPVEVHKFWEYYHAAYVAAGGERLQGNLESSGAKLYGPQAEVLLGVLTRAFREVGQLTQQFPLQVLFEFFKATDQGNTGFITLADFQQNLRSFPGEVSHVTRRRLQSFSPGHIEELFHWLDVTATGRIHVLELLNAVLQAPEGFSGMEQSLAVSALKVLAPYTGTLRTACAYLDRKGNDGGVSGKLNARDFATALDMCNFSLPDGKQIPQESLKATVVFVFYRSAHALEVPLLDYDEVCDDLAKTAKNNTTNTQQLLMRRINKYRSVSAPQVDSSMRERAALLKMHEETAQRRTASTSFPESVKPPVHAPSTACKRTASGPACHSNFMDPTPPVSMSRNFREMDTPSTPERGGGGRQSQPKALQHQRTFGAGADIRNSDLTLKNFHLMQREWSMAEDLGTGSQTTTNAGRQRRGSRFVYRDTEVTPPGPSSKRLFARSTVDDLAHAVPASDPTAPTFQRKVSPTGPSRKPLLTKRSWLRIDELEVGSPMSPARVWSTSQQKPKANKTKRKKSPETETDSRVMKRQTSPPDLDCVSDDESDSAESTRSGTDRKHSNKPHSC